MRSSVRESRLSILRALSPLSCLLSPTGLCRLVQANLLCSYHKRSIDRDSPVRSAKQDVACAMAAANMRLKLGQLTLADGAYEQLQRTRLAELTQEQRQMLQRKRSEAAAEMAQSASTLAKRLYSVGENEVEQLLRDRRSELPVGEGEALVRLLRRHGHAANEAGEWVAARRWFDCAFALSHATSDLLSAANMRAKSEEGSAAAEALYQHVCAAEDADDNERAFAARKLALLFEQRAALVASSDAAGNDGPGGERTWLFATALCAAREEMEAATTEEASDEWLDAAELAATELRADEEAFQIV